LKLYTTSSHIPKPVFHPNWGKPFIDSILFLLYYKKKTHTMRMERLTEKCVLGHHVCTSLFIKIEAGEIKHYEFNPHTGENTEHPVKITEEEKP